ncbi:hypothetical protein F5Y15DRAFT_147366 [Xylariaceae sp. FL0016]|nr:hypothetical protein F5Y15DRAFT_147366 [Xylariaceae sp. FL0016]
MAPDPHLGVSCPDGGNFYVCPDAAIRFVGCCSYDPCADGRGFCDGPDIQVASFDKAAYGLIPPQQCDPRNNTEPRWYTCRDTDPPFLGCCTENACEEQPDAPSFFSTVRSTSTGGDSSLDSTSLMSIFGSVAPQRAAATSLRIRAAKFSPCQSGRLSSAVLSDNATEAAPFLGPLGPSLSPNQPPGGNQTESPPSTSGNKHGLSLGLGLSIPLATLVVAALLWNYWCNKKIKPKKPRPLISFPIPRPDAQYPVPLDTIPLTPPPRPLGGFASNHYSNLGAKTSPSPYRPRPPPPVTSPVYSSRRPIGEVASTNGMDGGARTGLLNDVFGLPPPRSEKSPGPVLPTSGQF